MHSFIRDRDKGVEQSREQCYDNYSYEPGGTLMSITTESIDISDLAGYNRTTVQNVNITEKNKLRNHDAPRCRDGGDAPRAGVTAHTRRIMQQATCHGISNAAARPERFVRFERGL